MIKLNPTILENYKEKYLTTILSKINDNYSNNTQKMKYLNPFTGDKLEILFYKWNSNFLEDLVIQPIHYIIANYSEIEKYFNTAQLVYYSNFSVDYELTRYGLKKNPSSRQKFREQFVKKYTNDWITPILSNHKKYYENNSKFNKMIADVKDKLSKLNKLILYFINYSFLGDKTRHELLVSMDIPVCPYCNRQYITSYFNGKQNKTTADLDHILPKSFFPIFSLSLNNFIPSCQICNSRFKLNKGIEIINPYLDNFEANFKVSLTSNSEIDSIQGLDSEFKLHLKINEKNPNKKIILENTVDLFQLENVYQIHKNIVREALYKKNAYRKTYTNQLKKLFEDDMKLTETEINLFLYGNNLNPNDFQSRPLSKLTYDVLNDI
ncbi:HNH endonuclease [Bacillus tropicus]|uniref:HNH endonuclease n=1 Tax=Bacillus tropicus TaxID=2026188 RepID=UPI0037F55F8A